MINKMSNCKQPMCEKQGKSENELEIGESLLIIQNYSAIYISFNLMLRIRYFLSPKPFLFSNHFFSIPIKYHSNLCIHGRNAWFESME